MMLVENKYKIFIVEDSVFLKNKLMEILPELGFEIVGMAEDAKTSFRYVSETRPDVVLLDTSLPDMSAEETIRGLLAINPHLAIVIMSPLSNLREAVHLLQRGAMDYIPKPVIERQLEYILRKYEFSRGIRPVSKIESIAQIFSILYNEILEHSPRYIRPYLEKAIYKPIKRLDKKYSDRYEMKLNPIRIRLLMKTTSEGRIYKMYYNQLNRLYKSVLNNLTKELPIEYVKSLLTETFASFYSVARYLIEGTGYQFPEWQGFKPDFDKIRIDEKYDSGRIDYIYAENYHIIRSDYFLPTNMINDRISPYKLVLDHDPRIAPKFPKMEQINLESIDLHMVLSYFDDILGPTVATITPPPHGQLESIKLKSIPRLLDSIGATPNEPFIHASTDFGSVNTIFSVNLPKMRGGSRDYMLSIVITPVDVRALVRVNQMRTIMRATSSLLANHFYEHPEDLTNGNSLYVATETSAVMSDLYEETRIFLTQ